MLLYLPPIAWQVPDAIMHKNQLRLLGNQVSDKLTTKLSEQQHCYKGSKEAIAPSGKNIEMAANKINENTLSLESDWR